MFQVMHDRACGGDRRRHVGATETVERFDLEMLAQSETRVLWQKSVIVVGQRAIEFAKLVLLVVADQ